MIDLDITEVRNFTNLFAQDANFDNSYTFYYDETNNIKKFTIGENDFNNSFTANFVLGGLAHEDKIPNLQPLIDSLKLQKNTTEIKFKHIATGDFLDCLKSNRLQLFQQFIFQNDLFIHYSSLNILYWSLIDIVDSAIAVSEIAKQAGPVFANHLKNDLYKLSRLEINSVIKLFYKFEYPNVKKESVLPFIESLTSLFSDYIDTDEFHFGLESILQILKECKKQKSLSFIMNEKDYILLENFSQFYFRPVYMFKNSTHIFDNEDSISEIFKEHRFFFQGEEIKNYSFVDSKAYVLVQLSDILVGMIGKLTRYLNTHSEEKIIEDFASLAVIQQENVDLLIDLMDKSHNKNKGFLHHIDSWEEVSKMNVIRDIRNKN